MRRVSDVTGLTRLSPVHAPHLCIADYISSPYRVDYRRIYLFCYSFTHVFSGGNQILPAGKNQTHPPGFRTPHLPPPLVSVAPVRPSERGSERPEQFSEVVTDLKYAVNHSALMKLYIAGLPRTSLRTIAHAFSFILGLRGQRSQIDVLTTSLQCPIM